MTPPAKPAKDRITQGMGVTVIAGNILVVVLVRLFYPDAWNFWLIVALVTVSAGVLLYWVVRDRFLRQTKGWEDIREPPPPRS